MADILGEICGLDGNLNPSACTTGAEGFEDVAILINKRDVLSYTTSVPITEGGVSIGAGACKNVTGVVFKFAKNGYIQVGTNSDKEGGGNFENGVYTHLFNFRVKNADQKFTDRIQELNAGKVIAIVQTNNENFRVLGRVGGLVTQTANNEIQNADTQGGYQINMLAKARAYPDYFGIYTGSDPDKEFDFDATLDAFNSLIERQEFDIASVDGDTSSTTIVLSTVSKKPYVNEVKVGTKVFIDGIVGTIGTDATHGLNGKSFVISEIVNETTFKITTTGTSSLTYTSGGTAK